MNRELVRYLVDFENSKPLQGLLFLFLVMFPLISYPVTISAPGTLIGFPNWQKTVDIYLVAKSGSFLAMTVMILGTLFYRSHQIYIWKYRVLVMWLCALMVTSFALSPHYLQNLLGSPNNYTSILTDLACVVWILFFIIHGDQKKTFWTDALAGACLVAFIPGMLQAFNITWLDRFILFGWDYQQAKQVHQITHVASTLNNANNVGAFIALMFPMMFLSALRQQNRLRQSVYLVVSLMLLSLLIMSKAKAPFIGLGLTVLIMLVYGIFKSRSILFWAFFFVFGFTVLVSMQNRFHRYASYYWTDVQSFGETGRDPILQLKTHEDSLIFETRDFFLQLRADAQGVHLFDRNDKPLDVHVQNAQLKFTSPEFDLLAITLHENQSTKMLGFVYMQRNFLVTLKDQKPLLLVHGTAQPAVHRDYYFDGFDHLFAGRGFIWSRTLPLLFSRIFLGSGPGAFIIEFPQHEFRGKLNATKSVGMIIDKPHHWFFYYWFTYGLIFCVLLLFLCFLPLRHWLSQSASDLMPTALALVSYLATAIFYDPSITVQPYFWMILGIAHSQMRNVISPITSS